MTPLLQQDTGARTAFFLVLGLWILSEWQLRIRSHLNRRGARPQRRSLVVVVLFVYLGVFAGFALSAKLRSAAITDGRWAFFVTGLVLMCAGIAVRRWAVSVLGRFFTTDVRLQPGQVVVEDGPYRWVRHPSYTGLITTFVGIGFALGNWAAIVVLAVAPTAGLVVRIRDEERVLLDGLGEPYRRFAASRPRLFPGVW